MLNSGDVAPDFKVVAQSGEQTTLHTLTQSGAVIVYFYPADFSPVCSAEACVFRDNFDDLAAIGTQIVGVSPQDESSHERFSRTLSLPFPLVSDPKKRIVKSYGVDGLFGLGVRRATFLVGQDNIIKHRVVSDLFVGSHTDLIKQTLQSGRAA